MNKVGTFHIGYKLQDQISLVSKYNDESVWPRVKKYGQSELHIISPNEEWETSKRRLWRLELLWA